jgi:hypothetical protein
VHPLRFRRRERRGLRDPAFPFHRHALRDRRTLWEHATEIHVVPMRREMNPAVAIAVAIHQAAQRGERQIKTIDRMSEQHRIALRRFDAPQIVKLDHVPIGLEQR